MKNKLNAYSTFIFDCDGVILNSNKIKTEAFYQATLIYGDSAAQDMVNYHLLNGGVSRYKKFNYFIEHIAPKYELENRVIQLEELLRVYATYVRQGLLSCEIAHGLKKFRENTANARWLVVSGGDQNELRDIFNIRGIGNWFDGGIYGSPQDKEIIVDDLIKTGLIQKPALFLGDSKLDYEVAEKFNLDFVFLNKWSEFIEWEKYCQENEIQVISSVIELLRMKLFKDYGRLMQQQKYSNGVKNIAKI